MANTKGVVVVIGDELDVFSTASIAFEHLGWNYHTFKKKWKNDVIEFNGTKVYRKDIKR